MIDTPSGDTDPRKGVFFCLNIMFSLHPPMAKSANKGKKGQSKQNQGNATAKKAKNGGKKK